MSGIPIPGPVPTPSSDTDEDVSINVAAAGVSNTIEGAYRSLMDRYKAVEKQIAYKRNRAQILREELLMVESEFEQLSDIKLKLEEMLNDIKRVSN